MPARTTIQRKLVRFVLLITGAAVVVASTTILVYDLLAFRQNALEQVSTVGQVIASNITAALAFDNENDANEILAGLKVESPILAACLYDKKRQLFSQYLQDPAPPFPASPQADGYRFE